MRKLVTIHKPVVAACLAVALVTVFTVSGDASRIQSLRLEKSDGSSSFVISKMGTVEVQDFMMEDPPRLVVDFIGATFDMSESRHDGDERWVRQIRSSQFTEQPNEVTRVVFDLTQAVDYEVSTDEAAVTVRFFGDGAGTPATPSSSATGVGFGTAPVPPMTPATSVQPSDDGAADTDAPTMSTTSMQAKADETAAEAPAPKGTDKSENDDASKSDDASKNDDTSASSEAVPFWSAPPASTTTPATPQQPAKQSSPQSASPQSATPAMPQWNNTDEPAKAQPPLNWSSTSQEPGNQNFRAFATNNALPVNRTISIDVQEADINTVIRSMSEFSGQNIIAGPDVEGKVTAHLRNVPWRQALDIVLKSHGFGWREEYGVIRVATRENLTKEELEIQEAERRKDLLLPLETRIVALSFSNAGEMKAALKEVLTERGSIEVEKGNNALIITDISKNVQKLSAMVTELDRRIKQVEIVAKLVDVDYDATQEMGIRWDALNLSSTSGQLVGDAVVDVRPANPAATLRVGTVQSWGQVQAIVDLLAQENKANIISNPRIVTADNREASILVGKEIPLIVSDEAGNPITELTKVGIILRVTPHVNLDETITLDLHPEVSDLSAQATVQGGVIITLSEADTRLVVKDGETAVLGGLISETESKFEQGVPWLKDLPVLGGLFKLKSTNKKKRELIIFVTPTIVDAAVASNE